MTNLKEQIIQILNEDMEVKYELQRVLDLDFMESDIDEMKRRQEKTEKRIKLFSLRLKDIKGHNEAFRKSFPVW